MHSLRLNYNFHSNLPLLLLGDLRSSSIAAALATAGDTASGATSTAAAATAAAAAAADDAKSAKEVKKNPLSSLFPQSVSGDSPRMGIRGSVSSLLKKLGSSSQLSPPPPPPLPSLPLPGNRPVCEMTEAEQQDWEDRQLAKTVEYTGYVDILQGGRMVVGETSPDPAYLVAEMTTLSAALALLFSVFHHFNEDSHKFATKEFCLKNSI